jgi:hypothetical protein
MLTAIVLALVPVFLWALGVLKWVSRAARVQACAGEIRKAHEELCRELIDTRVLDVRVSAPSLDACLILLGRSVGGAHREGGRKV